MLKCYCLTLTLALSTQTSWASSLKPQQETNLKKQETHIKLAEQEKPLCPDYLNHEFQILHSAKSINLCSLYTGKPIIVINTASHCGYTRQFKGLEDLYKKYKSDGVELIGFTSNDFNQEAKSEQEAATICYKNYGVTFTMLSPSHVKGDNANPIFSHLAAKTESPSWNFNKYLITDNGNRIKKFDSDVKPIGSTLERYVKKALVSDVITIKPE